MKDKIREFREWATFGFTILTVLLFPIGALIMKNQKLEIEADADARYVSKPVFEASSISTNSKLDSIENKLSRVQQDIATIKGRQSGHY